MSIDVISMHSFSKNLLKSIGMLYFMMLFSACGSNKTSEQSNEQDVAKKPPLSEEVKAKAENIFQTRCTPCHGATGAGEGAVAATLSPKPRDLTSQEWQKSVTDDYIANIIKYGGAAVGKSPTMPSNPDLANNNEDVVQGLVSYIRDLSQK